jgi:hypothetical protein
VRLSQPGERHLVPHWAVYSDAIVKLTNKAVSELQTDATT